MTDAAGATARAEEVADRAGESLPGRTLRKFLEDQGPNQAVLIAWNALFAAFPIVIFILAILGFFLGLGGISSGNIQQDLYAALPGGAGKDLTDPLKNSAGVLAVVGILGLLWSGAGLFGSMESAFDLVYHTRPRNFLKQKLMAFGMIIVFTVLAGPLVLSASALPLIEKIPFFPAILTRTPLNLVLQFVTGVPVGFVLYVAIYYVVPNRRQKLGQVWPGALLAGVLLEVVTLVFPVYLNLNRGFNRFGQSLGLLFILMTYFYFLGMITMLGAELNAALYPIPIPQPDPVRALDPADARTLGEVQEGRAGRPVPVGTDVEVQRKLRRRAGLVAAATGSLLAGMAIGRMGRRD